MEKFILIEQFVMIIFQPQKFKGIFLKYQINDLFVYMLFILCVRYNKNYIHDIGEANKSFIWVNRFYITRESIKFFKIYSLPMLCAPPTFYFCGKLLFFVYT